MSRTRKAKLLYGKAMSDPKEETKLISQEHISVPEFDPEEISEEEDEYVQTDLEWSKAISDLVRREVRFHLEEQLEEILALHKQNKKKRKYDEYDDPDECYTHKSSSNKKSKKAFCC